MAQMIRRIGWGMGLWSIVSLYKGGLQKAKNQQKTKLISVGFRSLDTWRPLLSYHTLDSI